MQNLPGLYPGYKMPRIKAHLNSNAKSTPVISPRDIANMDQTPIQFVLLYMTQQRMLIKAPMRYGVLRASGLNKRQCTAQLTIFEDGVTRECVFLFH